MPQIIVDDLEKRFRVAVRDPGMLGAVRGLVRRKHRDIVALHNVSFAIEPGELVGYIGPNGAGKSTTIKILSGILTPSSGRCTVNGLVPWRDRVAHVARIGVVFGQRTQLWWDLPVAESFDLLRDMYRVDAARFSRARDELIDLLDLDAAARYARAPVEPWSTDAVRSRRVAAARARALFSWTNPRSGSMRCRSSQSAILCGD